ncbi:MAG: hypothetical protein A3I83_05870 [Methylotenera sp. RIFCSPLOWO2_02_FULL_45_14]|nr:MAG: hypothetical protein A3I83_05870 [Methylotenera sp. RIFCSPLOWO2_02_FULL_45_14]
MSKKKDKDDIAKLQKAADDYIPSKAERQIAFLKSCEGLSPKDAVNKAKLFQNVNREDFKIIKMVG